ncbi:MAG: BTAD domain-containing putative transcriptional regulator [Syntrophomonadaceae bacterium]|nr:BTAD domain-containing putative transcriptional regulator [Syntrophomonadaceae bacterium]MDD3024048.1 BTAD domain-containing putative transcriptional regulator [Syntrophomonadaceae bacterium]
MQDAEADPIRWRTAKAEELFALLIHYQGKSVAKEIIIDTLWPEIEYSRSCNNFYVTATYLRKALAEKGFTNILRRERDNYLLDTKQLECDILAFLTADNANSQDETNITAIEHALSLYKSAYFVDKPYEWAFQSRTWFEYEFIRLQYQLAKTYIRNGQTQKAAAALTRLIEQNPLEEEAVAMLISSKLQAGDTASAHRIYRKYEVNLRNELDIKPSPYLQDLFSLT